ncbi:MAG: FAD-dependent monooxygenase [Hyphomicrobiales bacterium]
MSGLNFDAIIVGAGPNGLALALALAGPQAQPKARVLVVDAKGLTDPSRSGDTRGSAITQATQNLLKSLGCFDAIQPPPEDMRSIAVTNGTGRLDARPVLLGFATEEGRPAAAAIAENNAILSALQTAAHASPGICWRTPARIAAITRSPGWVELSFTEGEPVRAPLLVGADGRNSFIRQEAGIGVDVLAGGQSALTFSISHSLPHHGRAEEHFTATGVIAFLPLPGNRMSLVWGTSDDEAQSLMALSDEAFAEMLTAEAGGHLGRIALSGGRQCYPLRRQLAKSLTAPRTALIGDAAHGIHPLAGLGLNLGFKDVAALAECIQDAMSRGEDWGGPAVLDRYAVWRRFDIITTAHLMEAMSLLFVNDVPVLREMRQAGLRIADRLPFFKAALMKEAAGLSGDVPRLMR